MQHYCMVTVMPYRVMSKKERDLEAWRLKDLKNVVKGVKAAEKLGLARRQRVRRNRSNMRIERMNAESYLRLSMNMEDTMKALYAFCRLKIQDPTTPNGRKKAFRQMCAFMEARCGGREWLCRDNPLIRKHQVLWEFNSHTPEAYKFCLVRPRVP